MFIEKMSTQFKIFEYILENKCTKPIDIASELKLNRQNIDYHLSKLLEMGYILRIDDNDGIFYVPQKCFVDDYTIESMCKNIKQILVSLKDKIDLSYATNERIALKSLILLYIDMILYEGEDEIIEIIEDKNEIKMVI